MTFVHFPPFFEVLSKQLVDNFFLFNKKMSEWTFSSFFQRLVKWAYGHFPPFFKNWLNGHMDIFLLFFWQIKFPPRRDLEFLTDHVTFKLRYNQISNWKPPWSDCIGYRIEIVYLFGTISTIQQHFTHNENQWPPAARRWHLALWDVSQSKVVIAWHPQVPWVWPYCRQAQCGHWHSLKWSIADLLTSSHPQMSACHWITGPARDPSLHPTVILTSFWKKEENFPLTF